MTVTPLLRLNLPAYDQPGWDDDINGNFSSIDALVGRLNTIAGYAGVWTNSTTYSAGQTVTDSADSTLWQAASGNTSAPTGTFAADRTAHPGVWTNVTASTNSAAASAAAALASQTAAAASATSASSSATTATTQAASASTSASSAAASVAATSFGTQRNYVRNPEFSVQQRGAGPFTTANVYGIDGWVFDGTGTHSVTPQAMTDVIRAQLADEEASFFYQDAFVGASGAADNDRLHHRIEGVRRLAGKTVIVSFYASCNAPDLGLGLEITQVFGTGSGSPSAQVTSIGLQKITITNTTWARYTSAPISIPSIAGKTLGTDSTDYTSLILWMSSGVNNATRASAVGVQTNSLRLWGVQVEIGSAATVVEKRDPSYELMINKRYAQLQTFYLKSASTGDAGSYFTFPVQMRALPSRTTITAGTLTNATVTLEAAADARGVLLTMNVTVAGGSIAGRINMYSAEL